MSCIISIISNVKINMIDNILKPKNIDEIIKNLPNYLLYYYNINFIHLKDKEKIINLCIKKQIKNITLCYLPKDIIKIFKKIEKEYKFIILKEEIYYNNAKFNFIFEKYYQ